MAAELFSSSKADKAMTSTGSPDTAGAAGLSSNGKRTMGGGLYEQAAATQVLAGKIRTVDPLLFNYDVREAEKRPLAFSVTKDDRLSRKEAGRMMREIHTLLGMQGEPANVVHALNQAMFFCHTLNGASVLNPERSTFGVPGKTVEFDFAIVKKKLGDDFRRFFRTYADQVKMVNQMVLDSYDPFDADAADAYEMLMSVASNRGLYKYPWLAHDSADACRGLTQNERMALAASKTLVLSSTINAADHIGGSSRTLSADKYDSTNMRNI